MDVFLLGAGVFGAAVLHIRGHAHQEEPPPPNDGTKSIFVMVPAHRRPMPTEHANS
jgi:hypothetical protein